MIQCYSFDRRAPRGQPPLCDYTEVNEHVTMLVQHGFLERPNYLYRDYYSKETIPITINCNLEPREYRRALVGLDGAVISPDVGLEVPNTLYHAPRFDIKNALNLPEAINLKQYSGTAYYHFVVEVLPRLLVCPDYGRAPLLIGGDPGDVPDFMHFASQYLQLLGYDPSRIVRCSTARVEHLLWPTYRPWNYGGEIPREPLVQLRQRLRPSSLINGQRVAIVAVRTKGYVQREVSNWSEVGQVLVRHGYRAEFVDFGSLPVKEQIALANQASVLIGASGGAMTNLVWLPDGAAVIDVHCGSQPSYNCLWHISSCLGLNYFTLFTGGDRKIDITALGNVLTLIEQ